MVDINPGPLDPALTQPLVESNSQAVIIDNSLSSDMYQLDAMHNSVDLSSSLARSSIALANAGGLSANAAAQVLMGVTPDIENTLEALTENLGTQETPEMDESSVQELQRNTFNPFDAKFLLICALSFTVGLLGIRLYTSSQQNTRVRTRTYRVFGKNIFEIIDRG